MLFSLKCKCDVGYRSDEDEILCLKNECGCKNGVEQEDNVCIKHNTQNCKSCNPGFTYYEAESTCNRIEKQARKTCTDACWKWNGLKSGKPSNQKKHISMLVLGVF